VVFTVGHGTRLLTELVTVLSEVDVDCLVDVRRYPGSRRNPQFARESLEHVLPSNAIRYEWWGESLGGRRKVAGSSRHKAWRVAAFQAYADHMDSPSFRAALRSLEGRASGGESLVFMCSETVWWRCHRRLVADALSLHGFEVIHLLAPGKRQEHPVHENVRLDEDDWPVYDAGLTGELKV
jgi:uncharacterized protein (DUF488 family)